MPRSYDDRPQRPSTGLQFQRVNVAEMGKAAHAHTTLAKKFDEALSFFAIQNPIRAFKLLHNLRDEFKDSKIIDAIKAKKIEIVVVALKQHKIAEYKKAQAILAEAPPPIQKRSNIMLERARVHYGFDEYKDAIALCNEVIDFGNKVGKDPKYPANKFPELNRQNTHDSYKLIAECYRKQKQHTKAQEIYQNLLKDKANTDIDVRDINMRISYCAEEAGDKERQLEASAAAGGVTKHTVDDARKLRKQGRYNEALRILKPIHQESIRNDVILEVVQCYQGLRQYKQALDAIESFVKKQFNKLQPFELLKFKMAEIRLYEFIGDLANMSLKCDEAEQLCQTAETAGFIVQVLQMRMRCLTEMSENPKAYPLTTQGNSSGKLVAEAKNIMVVISKRFIAAKNLELKGEFAKAMLELEQLADACRKQFSALQPGSGGSSKDEKTASSIDVFAEHADNINEVEYCYFKILYGLAINYEKNNRLDKVNGIYVELLLCQKIVRNHKFHLQILIAQARYFEKINNISAAEKNLMTAMRLLSAENHHNPRTSENIFNVQLALARMYQKSGQYQQAMSALEMLLNDQAIIKDIKRYSQIIVAKARIFEAMKNPHDAIAEFERVIKRYFDDNNSMRDAKISDSKSLSADETFARTLKQAKHAPFEIVRAWAIANANCGHLERAQAIMQMLMQQYNPTTNSRADGKIFIQASFQLAHFYIDARLFRQARVELERLNDTLKTISDAEFFKYNMQLARCYQGMGDIAAALECYIKLLAKFSNNRNYIFEIKLQQQWLYREIGDYAAAEKILNELAESYKDSPNELIKTLDHKIQCFKQMGSHEKVVAAFNELIFYLETNGRIHQAFEVQMNFAIYYSKNANHIEAKRIFSRLEGHPLFKVEQKLQRKLLLALADAHVRNAEFYDAKQCLDRLVKEFPKDLWLKQQLAIIKSKMNKKVSDSDFLDADRGKVNRSLAEHYLRIGQTDKALNIYHELVNKNKYDASIRVALINVYIEVGEASTLQRAVKESEDFLKQPCFEFEVHLHLVHIEALLAAKLTQDAQAKAQLFVRKFSMNRFFRNRLMELFFQAEVEFISADEKSSHSQFANVPVVTVNLTGIMAPQPLQSAAASGVPTTGITKQMTAAGLTTKLATSAPRAGASMTTILGQLTVAAQGSTTSLAATTIPVARKEDSKSDAKMMVPIDPFSAQNLKLLLNCDIWQRYEFFRQCAETNNLHKLYHNLRHHDLFHKLFPPFQTLPSAENSKNEHHILSKMLRNADNMKGAGYLKLNYMYEVLIAKEAYKFTHLPWHEFKNVVTQIAVCYGIAVPDSVYLYRKVRSRCKAMTTIMEDTTTHGNHVAIKDMSMAAMPLTLYSSAVEEKTVRETTQTTGTSQFFAPAPPPSMVTGMSPTAAAYTNSVVSFAPVYAEPISIPIVPAGEFLPLTAYPPEVQLFHLQKLFEAIDQALDNHQQTTASLHFQATESVVQTFILNFAESHAEILPQLLRKLTLLRAAVEHALGAPQSGMERAQMSASPKRTATSGGMFDAKSSVAMTDAMKVAQRSKHALADGDTVDSKDSNPAATKKAKF